MDSNPQRDRWEAVERLLDAVVELPPAQRTQFLANADVPASVRAEVERLLALEPDAEHFMERPLATLSSVLAAAADTAGADLLPERVGPYRVVREAGHGGMGRVFLGVRDDEQFRLRVALKLVRRGADMAELARRFREERQILATLTHPGIARLLDGGVTDDGVPWLAMEYVEGTPIDRYCDEQQLGAADRIRLVCRVCDAVHHAHRNLVVHRDLKPSNILVTQDGEPKLLDFGIARLLESDPAATDAATDSGDVVRVLTPGYASPEQVRGEAVSTASDVYSLGVLLHKLLTGSLPPAATPQLRDDVGAVVAKALQARPELRYASAQALAEDLHAVLSGRPVSARVRTRGYVARRFIRRHRVSVAVGSALLLVLVGFSALTGTQAMRLRAQTESLVQERDRAAQAAGFLVDLLTRGDPYRAGARVVTPRAVLDSITMRVETELAHHPDLRARVLVALGETYWGQGHYDPAKRLLGDALALRIAALGEDHLDVASIRNLLGLVMRQRGEFIEAEPLYRQVLATRIRHLGAGHPDVARTLSGLALTLRNQGRMEEAETLLRQALAIDDAHSAANPAALSGTLNALGHVLRERGDAAAAESHYREALRIRRMQFGDDHPEVAQSMANVALALRDRGDLAAAEPLFRESLSRTRRLLGREHPDNAVTVGNLAELHRARGEHNLAEALYREALEHERRVLSAPHHRIATTLAGLGRVLLERGEHASAEPLLREALSIRTAVLPPGHDRITEAEQLLAAARATCDAGVCASGSR